MLRNTWHYKSMKMGQISEITLFVPKFGTFDPLIKANGDDVTVMTSWWNIFRMFGM